VPRQRTRRAAVLIPLDAELMVTMHPVAQRDLGAAVPLLLAPLRGRRRRRLPAPFRRREEGPHGRARRPLRGVNDERERRRAGAVARAAAPVRRRVHAPRTVPEYAPTHPRLGAGVGVAGGSKLFRLRGLVLRESEFNFRVPQRPSNQPRANTRHGAFAGPDWLAAMWVFDAARGRAGVEAQAALVTLSISGRAACGEVTLVPLVAEVGSEAVAVLLKAASPLRIWKPTATPKQRAEN
jgi:hypothetical protein